MNLPAGFVSMPGSQALNRALQPLGLGADLAVIDRSVGLDFGRRAVDAESGSDPKSPADLAAAASRIRASVNVVADLFDLPYEYLQTGDGQQRRPMLTAVGYHAAPHRIPSWDLVALGTSHGYLPDEYTHGPSLGLVLDGHFATKLALLTSLADAPPVFVVFVGTRRDGTPLVVSGTAQANWLVMHGMFSPGAPEEHHKANPDLLGRLVHEVKWRIEVSGGDVSNGTMFAFVGPGASEHFKIKAPRSHNLSAADRDRYITSRWVQTDTGAEPVDELNLRGWAAGRLRELVGSTNVYVLDHNTVGNPDYTSKRTLVGADVRTVDATVPIPSNAAFLNVRPRRQDDDES